MSVSFYVLRGLRPIVQLMSAENIIKRAVHELRRSGESLEDLAGISWIERDDGSLIPLQELSADEALALSVQKLGDNGRMFRIFTLSQAGGKKFVGAASHYCLNNEAQNLVKNHGG